MIVVSFAALAAAAAVIALAWLAHRLEQCLNGLGLGG